MKRALVVFASFVSVSLLGCGGPAVEVEADVEAETGSTVTQSSCTGRQCNTYEGACMLVGGKALCCDGDAESTCSCVPPGRWVCG